MLRLSIFLVLAIGAGPFAMGAQTSVRSERKDSAEASPAFKFSTVPPPAKNDAASNAKVTMVDGRRDPNGGEIEVLHDGKAPVEEDAPAHNFFFRAGTDGGRLLLDLGKAIEITAVNSYSWHGSSRAPQVYRLYASNGKGNEFNREPKKGTDPEKCGWALLAQVDTRPKSGEPGGQYGVSIGADSGSVGTFQLLLFDISQTEDTDAFGNTFFSEIDVIDLNGPPLEIIQATANTGTNRVTIEAGGGKYKITIDTSDAPDLTDWALKELVPLVQEWYPKMVDLLGSEGYVAPEKFSIVFNKDMRGVADTSGTRIRCAARWIRQNLKGEAKGAVFHEMIHVVQQYGRARRAEGATRPPGWLTEGLTDYLRFYVYEPQTRGAEIRKANLERARYDGSYRVTGNFLNWVGEKHGTNFVPKLNAIIRQGKYNEEFWKKETGRTLPELGEAWKKDLEKKLTPATPQSREVKPD